MQIGTRFYRSMYVTLGLACACLGYAELPFLPEMSAFAALVGVLLVVAYRLEGRWALSIPAANVLGGVIAAGAVAWVAYQFFRPWGVTLLDQLPWPTSLLPYLGPLLMILVPAKLFRPKHTGDFWGLQGVGLIAVALGCAMAGDVLFGLMLLAYLVSLMWSLTLFYYHREHLRAGEARTSLRRVATPRRLLSQAGSWVFIVAGLALLLFLGTPRSGEARWELSLNAMRLQTGVDDTKPDIDLNNSGTLRVNRDLVFEVQAYTLTPERQRVPKTDLDPAQRWRGHVFNYYDRGRWENRVGAHDVRRLPGRELSNLMPLVDVQPIPAPTVRPFPLDPDEFFLEYHPHTRSAHTQFLAEPVTSPIRGERRSPPVVSLPEEGGRSLPWGRDAENELRPPVVVLSWPRHFYRQRVTPRPDLAVSPPVEDDENYREHLRNHQAVPRLREWTRALLQRLADEGRLPAAALDRPEDGDVTRIDPKYYEAVARGLEAYLSQSGEYKYSLTLQRQDLKLDPVEDFLFNIRKGHCNRYASALALMLRTQGVPTRIVLGYHGLEPDDDHPGSGVYFVRQCYAHSWVEALVRRDEDGQRVWRWLTLDPTPAGEDAAAAEFQWGNWWEAARTGVSALFKNFIVEYDADQQDRAYTALGRVEWGWWPRAALDRFLGPDRNDWRRAAVISLGLLGAALVARRWWRRGRAAAAEPADPAPAFYRRFLDLAARHLGLRPQGGQTPTEFAAAAGARLRAAPATHDLADLPGEAAALYYQVRYGGRPLDAAAWGALDARLDRLAASLGRRKDEG
jgi:transglutaminase-like putative cysteine protease